MDLLPNGEAQEMGKRWGWWCEVRFEEGILFDVVI